MSERRARSSAWLLAIGCTVALCASAAGGATGRPSSLERLAAYVRQVDKPTGSATAPLRHVATVARARGLRKGLAAARREGLGIRGGRVKVVVAAKPGRVSALRAAIKRVGGRPGAAAGNLVLALVPPAALSRLAAAPTVAAVRPPAKAVPAAVGEGLPATNASAWHTAGFAGAGVKIAIVDLGFTGYAALLGTALPATVETRNYCGGVIDDSDPAAAAAPIGATDHGTAVAEVAHQMAPGASLLLICVEDEVGLALAEQYAFAHGAKIVNHSVSWLNTSRGDGTAPGTPEAPVAAARSHGMLWVNAVGDLLQTHWRGPYVPGTDDPDMHQWSDELNDVVIANGEEACFYLRWDHWPTTSEDFDLYVIREADQQVVSQSIENQADEMLPPVESTCYTNPGPSQQFGVAIVRWSASGTPVMDLFVEGIAGSIEFHGPGDGDGSITEPASSPAAVAVGAVCWDKGSLESYEDDVLDIENYSSAGPTVDGRLKPDLVAPDAVSTTTYGTANAQDCNAGFRGTSASAPHVSGAAALLLANKPSFSPAALEAFLNARAFAHSCCTNVNNAWGHNSLWLGGLPLDEAHVGTLSTSALPSITGEARVGRPLEATTGKWSMSRSASQEILRFSYSWLRCDPAGGNCTAVPGAGESFYKPVAADVGARLRVTVAWSGGLPASGSATSASSAIVVPAKPLASSAPAVTGTAQAGSVLVLASPGSWSGSPSFTYQWHRCDFSGSECVSVPGANGAAYTLTEADVESVFRVAVTGTNAGGSGIATSPSTSDVVSRPPDVPDPPTMGSATAGDRQATVSFTPPASPGSFPIVSYTVTAAPGGQSASGVGSPITVPGLENGTTYTFFVTATNQAGTGPASAPSAPAVPFRDSRVTVDPPAVTGQRPEVPDFPPPPGVRKPPPTH